MILSINKRLNLIKLFDSLRLPTDLKDFLNNEYMLQLPLFLEKNYKHDFLLHTTIHNTDISPNTLKYLSNKFNIKKIELEISFIICLEVSKHTDIAEETDKMSNIYVFKSNNRFQINCGKRKRILKQGNVLRFNTHLPHSVDYINLKPKKFSQPIMLLLIDKKK